MKMCRLSLAVILISIVVARTDDLSRSPPRPLVHAHAHNDYEHQRPLLDALDQGFCSIEADIYLVNGKLLVAHDLKDVKPERTLQALYLEPLRQRAKEHKGRIYQNGPTIILLIDVKSDADATYAALRPVLKEYADIFTRFEQGRSHAKAVTAIISGNRARELLAAEPIRYVAIDGRLPDLESNPAKELIPLVSDNWNNHFQWRGNGTFPFEEREKLRKLVEKTHAQSRQIRFWGTPDKIELWQELSKAGVDLINTDDLQGLRRFLSGQLDAPGKDR